MELDVIHNCDCIEGMKQLPDNSIDCCITSPPYYGLRDYGVDGQIGLEDTPEEYVKKMVHVFAEVRRVLKPTGVLWLNLGDSYWASRSQNGLFYGEMTSKSEPYMLRCGGNHKTLKPKDLIGIPWRVALALQADGWYLRSDIIWAKPNVMPESVTDRPTKSHEYIFLMSKSSSYYYDHEAIKEPCSGGKILRCGPNSRANVDRVPRVTPKQDLIQNRRYQGFNERYAERPVESRNKRDVWIIATKPYNEAHFAMFPEKLIEPCVLAGCPKDGIILDPFMGAGTTALVATRHYRHYIGFELNPEYVKLANKRISAVQLKFA
jgi:DNA modification methylase